MRVWAGLLVLGISGSFGCLRLRDEDAAIRAVVRIPSAMKSTCLELVTSSGSLEIISERLARDAKSQLVFAVYRGRRLPEKVEFRARGYAGGPSGCAAPLTLIEQSPAIPGTFSAHGVNEVILTLGLRGPDEDQDGFIAQSAGGNDCDDRHATIHPGVPEACGDQVDNNCDGDIDCAESSCQAQPCLGGVCQNNACVPVPKETQCQNGLDDDNDGLKDCADPDCQKQTCAVGCTMGICASGACQPTGANPCQSPPGECFSVGTCASTQSCVYPPRTGESCSQGNGVCLSNGKCDPLFPYSVKNVSLPDPSAFTEPVDLNCVGSAINTSGTAAQAFTAWCGTAVKPTAAIVTSRSGSGEILLLTSRALTLRNNATLRITGTRPVVWLVRGDVRINGLVDVSSNRGQGLVGPGAAFPGSSVCDGAPGLGVETAGGGGGGGGNATPGPSGGAVSASDSAQGTGGTALTTDPLSPLRAGCSGGNGGTAVYNDRTFARGGLGGNGGGALQISASGLFELQASGVISASGAGGDAGEVAFLEFNRAGGGGGGGSGGNVLVQSLQATLAGTLTANGGGGGEGGGSATTGRAGNDGALSSSVPAPGGRGESTLGGDGGNGAAGSMPPEAGHGGTHQTGGGGGGGGALGRIRVESVQGCTRNPGGMISASLAGCP